LFMFRGAGLAGVLFWSALSEVVRVRARAGQVVPDAPGAELASGVSVGLGVAPVGALRWLYVASVISVRV
jgi:hypothetical protein